MRVWRMTFKGHYPEIVHDFVGNNLEDAIVLAGKYFHSKGQSINTKTDLVDVILLSDNVIREVNSK